MDLLKSCCASFDFDGQRFVVWEPFGDNDCYWIGPADGEKYEIDLTVVHHSFAAYRFPIARLFYSKNP